MSIRILIVEDEPAIARNLALMIQAKNYKLAGIAYDHIQALDKLAQGTTDLVILDINLSGHMEGIEIGNMLNDHYKIPFIYLTSYADDVTLKAAKLTHPSGYIVKPFEETQVYASIQIAWHNASLRDNSTIDLEKINNRIACALTRTEFKILQDLITGMPYAQIATKNHISINTVNSHVKKIYAKLEVNSRIEALKFCTES